MKKGYPQTKKEVKHEMLLDFVANARQVRKMARPAPPPRRLLKTIMSLFM